MGLNLHLLRESLDVGTDGVLELLDGVQQRNPAAVYTADMDKIQSGK